MGRKLSVFKPIDKGRVRMYTCGPTVWNYAHVGNFRTFIFEDVLRRYLEYSGYRVEQVKNLTDVEDKIIKGMKATGKSLKELTEFYVRAFMEDLSVLNAEKAENYPKATENIPEMVSMIKSLMQKGYAYRGDDGCIYYSVRKFKRYGKLSGIKPSGLKAGARVSADSYEKMGAQDFALWKAWNEEDGDAFWETELGKGRPGWHIECSAMAMKYLGESFDIHTGGKDLRFPHHENEIAQSEALTGKRFAKYWLHSEFLRINGEEMHKSAGNIVTLRELLSQGWNKKAIRLFLMSGHYRDELNLNDESLAQAEANIERIDQFVKRLKGVRSDAPGKGKSPQLIAKFQKEFERAMDADLNVPNALAAFFRFQRRANSLIDSGDLSRAEADSVIAALKKVDRVLGIMTFEEEVSLPDSIMQMIREREEARRAKDFRRADELRAALKKEGISVQDTPSGTLWKRDDDR